MTRHTAHLVSGGCCLGSVPCADLHEPSRLSLLTTSCCWAVHKLIACCLSATVGPLCVLLQGTRRVLMQRATPQEFTRGIYNPLAMSSRGRYILAENLSPTSTSGASPKNRCPTSPRLPVAFASDSCWQPAFRLALLCAAH